MARQTGQHVASMLTAGRYSALAHDARLFVSTECRLLHRRVSPKERWQDGQLVG